MISNRTCILVEYFLSFSQVKRIHTDFQNSSINNLIVNKKLRFIKLKIEKTENY